MIHLLQSSEMLRTILFIIDESVTILDTYLSFRGKHHLEVRVKIQYNSFLTHTSRSLECCSARPRLAEYGAQDPERVRGLLQSHQRFLRHADVARPTFARSQPEVSIKS